MKFEYTPNLNNVKQETKSTNLKFFEVFKHDEKIKLEKFNSVYESDKSIKGFIKAIRMITAVIALTGTTPTTVHAENSLPQQKYSSGEERLSKTEIANNKTEENIENFNIPGLSIGKVKNLERGIHYQRGLYLNGEHLGDIIYPEGRVVEEYFFIERIYQILKENGLKNFD